MDGPSRRTSRLALAAGVAAFAAAATGGFLLGRGAVPRTVVPAPPPPPAPPIVAVPPPPPAAPLDRAALIAAARVAADAVASGRPPGSNVQALDGARFELRLPFGCDGPAAADAPLGWRYDPDGGVLRVRATPVRWPTAEWAPPDADPPVEAIEGFWIARPWILGETCPPSSPSPTPASPPPVETLGLAQFLTAGEPRVGRRDGRAFEAVERVGPDALGAGAGFRLRLRGHVAAPAAAAPITCRTPAGGDRPPVCLIAIVLDEVAIERPGAGAALAEWAIGRPASDLP